MVHKVLALPNKAIEPAKRQSGINTLSARNQATFISALYYRIRAHKSAGGKAGIFVAGWHVGNFASGAMGIQALC